jgi:adenylate cyclase
MFFSISWFKVRFYLSTFFVVFVFAGTQYPSAIHAQTANDRLVDSLRLKLKSNLPDSLKAKLHKRIGQYLVDRGFGREAKSDLLKALFLYKKQGNALRIAEVQNMLGIAYYYSDETEMALKQWNEALRISQTLGDSGLIFSVKNNLVNGLTSQGNYPESINLLYELIATSEQKGDSSNLAQCLSNLSIIYAQIGEYEKGIQNIKRAIPISQREKNFFALISSYQTLGNIYELNNQFEESLQSFEKFRAIAEKENYTDKLPNAYYGIAIASQRLKRYSESLMYFRKAKETCAQLGSDFQLDAAIFDEGLAGLYFEVATKNEPTLLSQLKLGNARELLIEARELILKSIPVFKENQDLENLKICYSQMSKVEKALNNYKDAFQYFEWYQTLSDSLFNLERDKKITQKEMQYSFDKKEALQKAEQEKKDLRQGIIRNSMFIGLSGAFIFSLVVWRQRNRISKEKARSENLLLNILPEEVADELKEKGEAEARLMDEVTVLFTDFKGFTALSEQVTPKELVRDLHSCFSAFDAICGKYGIEKIKTIGDAYMAAGGLPTPNITHAKDVAMAALEMVDFVEQGKANKTAAGLPYFEIRVGIHTGPVVAGIVGVKKFQYDIWGDTVNTASRMESSGEVGKVNVSETTWQQIKNESQFRFEHRGKVSAKGKGEMEMYFVELAENNKII